jgi:hypothetical protein
MKKRLLSSMLLVLLSVAGVHGASKQYGYAGKEPKLADKMKFGARVGVNINFWVVGCQ